MRGLESCISLLSWSMQCIASSSIYNCRMMILCVWLMVALSMKMKWPHTIWNVRTECVCFGIFTLLKFIKRKVGFFLEVPLSKELPMIIFPLLSTALVSDFLWTFCYSPERILPRIKFVASQIGPNESTKQIKREAVCDCDNHAHLLTLEHAIATNSTATYIDEKFPIHHL